MYFLVPQFQMQESGICKPAEDEGEVTEGNLMHVETQMSHRF